ncbi:MAG: DUF2459 domain-containing protein [Desulfococcaceae bacterium]
MSCVHGQGLSTPGAGDIPVWVVNHGWHTGIAFPTEAIPSRALPPMDGIEQHRYLEFGWGDAQFYQAGGGGFWLAFRALFWPTDSVLHVVGFDLPADRFFAASQSLSRRVSSDELARLLVFLEDTFFMSPAGEPKPLGPGLYGNSRFFQAKGRYLFPETCNVWTARALAAMGCRVRPLLAMTADGLMGQARRCGFQTPSSDLQGVKDGDESRNSEP